MSNKVALVTGASSGIGYETALELQSKGFTVYATARRLETMKKLEEKGINVIHLDVTNEDSMQSCINTIVNKEGRIDVLVNNAGYGSYGSVEDVSMEEARRQLEVNIFGLARLTQLIIPHMRKQNYGKIVNISSVGGQIYTLLGAWYHTTKFALEGFSNSLRLELKPFGIDVIVIQPGAIKTEWAEVALDNLKKTSQNGAYKETSEKVAKMMSNYSGSPATVISKLIGKAVTVNKPKARYAAGQMAKPLLFIRKITTDKMFDKIMMSLYK